MQLVLPSVAAPRGATTDRGPIRPLPVDLDAWRHAVVVADLPAARVRVHAIVEAETAAGWPCTLVRSDLLDDADALLPWAQAALDAARRSAAKKPAKKRK